MNLKPCAIPLLVGDGASSRRHCPARKGDTVGVCAAKRGLAELVFSLSLAAGACVRVWYDHPAPQALSPSQCPKPSTFVRDRKGKSFCSCAESNPSRPAWGGGPMEVRVAFFPARIEGLGASNSCRISPMTQAEGGRDGGRERFRWPECTPGRPLAHSLTHSLNPVPSSEESSVKSREVAKKC